MEQKNAPVPDGTAEIELTKGYVAWVDADLLERLSRYDWHAAVRISAGGGLVVYAASASRPVGEPIRDKRIIYMHRLICQGKEVDHISHNMAALGVVDNRSSNLRPVHRKQNARNVRKSATCKSSIFKGVGWEHFTGRWKAYINVNNRGITLGRFDHEVNAAYAYDIAAVRLFGDYALTNFPVPGSINSLFG